MGEMPVIKFATFCLVLAMSSFFLSAPPAGLQTLTLTAGDLFNGARAERVVLSSDGRLVTLDIRNMQGNLAGVIETDPLDLYDPVNAGIGIPNPPLSYSVKVNSRTPTGTVAELSYRAGSSFFTGTGWSGWAKANGLELTIDRPKVRYLQLRLDLRARDREQLPAVAQVVVTANFGNGPGYQRNLKPVWFDNERIIRSAYHFEWERPDNPSIRRFMESSGYADSFSRGRTEFEKMTLLSRAVAATPNDRSSMWDTNYPWDVSKLHFVKDGRKMIEGHCLSYAVVLVSAMTGVNQYARHWAVRGFREMDHEVVEAWSNELKKWIYLDPSLSQHYLDPRTKMPLSLLEMHDIINRAFIPDGRDWLMPMDALAARIKAVGGKTPIICVDQGWHYGERAPADYDWGWFHGYLAAGFLRLTPRNNFHSKKEPWFPHFGEGQSFDAFVSYVDEKTPPFSPEVKHFSSRMRDFWFTLNQASIKAARSADGTVDLEFGNSQPFFKRYRVSLNGAPSAPAESPYRWILRPGANVLAVTPEDEWGNKGISSSIRVDY
jgi:hypothetical protein